MHPLVGFVGRVLAVTVVVVGIRELLRVKPTEKPSEHTVEQMSIMGIVACSYGWDKVSKSTGFSVTELLLLHLLCISCINYVWYYQRELSNDIKEMVDSLVSPHDTNSPPSA